VLSKRERLKIFLQRLEGADPANSFKSGMELLSKTLNAVEDEFSGVPFNRDAWLDDGRMYPPTESNRRPVAVIFLRRYRSARHNTFVGLNGAIRIEQIDGNVILDKPGADGRTTNDLADV